MGKVLKLEKSAKRRMKTYAYIGNKLSTLKSETKEIFFKTYSSMIVTYYIKLYLCQIAQSYQHLCIYLTHPSYYN